MRRILWTTAWLAWAVLVSGCAKSPSAAAPTAPERETWEVFRIQGQRAGYGHTIVRSGDEAGQPMVRTDSENHLAVKRAGQTTTVELHGTSVETPKGELIRFESEMQMGPSPQRTVGRVHGSRLEMEISTGGAKATPESIDWADDYRGPFAVEQSLRRAPMQPRERRSLKTFLIESNQVADVELNAKTREPTPLLRGTYDLLRIDTLTRLPDGQKIEGTLWADRTGEVLKSHSPAMGLETYRATEAEALEKSDAAELDLFAMTNVPVQPPLAHPHQTRRVRYRVELQGGDPAGAFATGPTQRVTSIDANTAEITVFAVRPGRTDGNRDARADPPTDDDRKPNRLIQSDDPTIVADAKQAAGDESDPWRVATALEQFVHREVKKKNYTQGFASAAEVARSREGDCTEHAVFLAALCRARGIPARVAMGLVYMEPQAAFGYHLWTEACVDGRWIPIDGTLGQGGIGAAHLKVGQTNLHGVSPYAAFLPVANLVGRLKVNVIESSISP